MNKKNIILLVLAIIFLVLAIITQPTTKYATIKGESFTIPKQEGDYYYEK